MKTKIIKKHTKGCAALRYVREKKWHTPWSGVIHLTHWRDKRGGETGSSHMWHETKCNSIRCSGLMLFNFEEDLPSK